MHPLVETVAATLCRRFEAFLEQTQTLVRDLSEEEFWSRPYPYGNSVGHLLLHLTGNLHYYIGAEIAGTGYQRDRVKEFTDSQKRLKAHVLEDLAAAVSVVTDTVRAQTADSWTAAYSAVGTDETTRFGIVLRCTHHFHHHLGQIIYLCREHETRRSR